MAFYCTCFDIVNEIDKIKLYIFFFFNLLYG